MSGAAPRVVRGWLAALVCTWTAFASHAHAAPTAVSAMVMLVITCISAVIAMVLLGRKFNLLATSVLVLISQGLYHVSLSVMTHHGSMLHAVQGTGVHANHVTALSVAGTPVATETGSMLLAHLAAAVVSILVLRQGEQLARAAVETLNLSVAHKLLASLRFCPPAWPRVDGFDERDIPVLSRNTARLPLLRGPPSPVLAFAN